MSRDRCVISHVNSACSATYSVHDSHVIHYLEIPKSISTGNKLVVGSGERMQGMVLASLRVIKSGSVGL